MERPKATGQQRSEYYIVPARHLSGTRDEVLEQIDELIQGLVGLRQLVSLHGPKPADAPKRNLRPVKRFINAIFAL
jgi:hypothetical protein